MSIGDLTLLQLIDRLPSPKFLAEFSRWTRDYVEDADSRSDSAALLNDAAKTVRELRRRMGLPRED